MPRGYETSPLRRLRRISARSGRPGYARLSRPIEKDDRNPSVGDRSVEAVEGDERVAEREEDRAGEAGPLAGSRRAGAPDPSGGAPHHRTDRDHVGYDRRPQVAQARPQEGGHAGAVGG